MSTASAWYPNSAILLCYRPMRLLRDVRDSHALCCYDRLVVRLCLPQAVPLLRYPPMLIAYNVLYFPTKKLVGLSGCYTMSEAPIRYAATAVPQAPGKSIPLPSYAICLRRVAMHCTVLVYLLCCYALAMRCGVLRWAMLRQAKLSPEKTITMHRYVVSSATCLRACYAMSGTDIAYGATCLRACYAVSGTDMAHGAVCLGACYAMSGTDIAYGGTRLRQPSG
eukprot:1873633-Rhodomonas_salina.1